MNSKEFITAYNAGRNGVNGWAFNPLYRKLHYSDGFKQCAEAGLYWVLHIIGTETVQAYAKYKHLLGDIAFVYLKVAGATAELSLTSDAGETPVWTRRFVCADAPEGTWCFYLSNNGGIYRLSLPTEY